MNDKDFDDIGKRLYNEEADPPKNGWDKLAPALNAPTGGGKVVWLKKNWWKPLVVAIPVSLYLFLPLRDGNLKLTSSVSGDQSLLDGVEKKAGAGEKKVSGIDEAPVEISATEQRKKESASETPVIKATPHKAGRKTNTVEREEESGELSEELTKDPVLPVQAIQDQTILTPNSTLYEESKMNTGAMENREFLDTKTLVQSEQKEVDSIASAERVARQDSVSGSVEETEEDKSLSSAWRITASFAPQYGTKSIRPVANDDVFITNIRNTSAQERIGFSFSLGAGKAITPNLYLDAQLSYTQTKQDIFYSYSTGNVDTLVAVMESDQTVRVMPVYKTENRNISSQYGFGGIRLGGTYYFWSTPRRRFNLAASAGAHYLLTSDIKESVDGQWVSLGNEDMNKVNYSVMFGGGYNINLNQGWELMINPAITYYMRSMRSRELPYNINQRSFGLNIMLSKTIGLK